MKPNIIPLTISMPFGDSENIVHPVLLWDNESLILVDCGFRGSLPLIEKELEKHELKVTQITGLVLTHHDHDHMGAARALKNINPDLLVYASEKEAPYISGQEKPLRLRQAEELQEKLPPEKQAFGKAFCELLRSIEPVPVDIVLSDNEMLRWCGGCQVLLTPGHTPGHLSLYMTEANAVITGDAFALENNRPVIANPQFTLDMEQASKSMEKLLALDADTHYCYHGGVYSSVEGSR
ncbi:MAG: MBL fold metallo-hydrolase [Bacillota bacterium]|jgi:glyoxylase-like metal-dependent hydrolase (beta-lactamase superfamily II)|nr:MBL fold metallo-hydrolase [Bacillota bacterium]HOA91645.1 MBL fold metallo-hydrolase [Bacillota bacterium]HPZ73488.1 MBL fold metallo-hydrolase [Bacillota bacterium]HQD79024.1 MBL fold metallo-hydrolase [Bacillota bacterium]